MDSPDKETSKTTDSETLEDKEIKLTLALKDEEIIKEEEISEEIGTKASEETDKEEAETGPRTLWKILIINLTVIWETKKILFRISLTGNQIIIWHLPNKITE